MLYIHRIFRELAVLYALWLGSFSYMNFKTIEKADNRVNTWFAIVGRVHLLLFIHNAIGFYLYHVFSTLK